MPRTLEYHGCFRSTLAARWATVLVLVLSSLAFLGVPAALAQENSVVAATHTVILEVNEGKLIRLNSAATSVFIANPAIADVSVKSSRLVYVFGTKTGETTLFAVGDDENIIADMRIRVSHNVSRLSDAINKLLPQGGVTATSLDGGIVLSGAVDNATQSENINRLAARFITEGEEVINQLALTAPNQINLRVRFAEISREVLNEFGINWEAAFVGATDFLFGVATGGVVVPSSLFGTQTVSPNVAATALANPGGLGPGNFLTRQGGFEQNNIFFRSTFGDYDVNGLIDLLAQDGLVTVLAEPNLTALSGETASFLAGGEFPIPVAQRNNNLTIEFKKFGVSLAFTPTILNNNRISMRVRPEVSQLSNAGAIMLNNIQIPALTTRRAETTIELGSGQSFAIAGLLLDTTRQTIDEVPGLSNIPILGSLFRSDRFERDETELVIIVTPYIVRPVASERLFATPTDPYVNRAESTSERETAMSPAQPQTLSLGSRGDIAGGGPPIAASGFILE